MKHQEKKYRVDSFARIERLLTIERAEPLPPIVSIHYYADHPGSDVVKLVSYPEKHEIHKLRDHNGTFSLTERLPVTTREAGFQYLRDQGYPSVSVVQMEYRDYELEAGLVGLYTINGFLRSVILDYPEGKHQKYAELLGLTTAEIITLPYNKYLAHIGRDRKMNLHPENGTYVGHMDPLSD